MGVIYTRNLTIGAVTNNSCIVKGCIKFVSRRQDDCSGQDSGIQQTPQSFKSKLPVPVGYYPPILGALRHRLQYAYLFFEIFIRGIWRVKRVTLTIHDSRSGFSYFDLTTPIEMVPVIHHMGTRFRNCEFSPVNRHGYIIY